MDKLRKLRRVLLSLLLAALFAAVGVPAFAAEEASAIRLVKTEGTVAVTDGSGKEATLRQNMRLYSGYHVSTGEDGYAWLSLDDTKAVKLDLDSAVEIRQSGKKLELLLEKGELFFNVSAPLEQDETLNIRTSNMVTGIRGTSGYAQVVSRSHSRLCILEGIVACSVVDPVTGQRKSAELRSGDVAELYSRDRDEKKESCEIDLGKVEMEEISGSVLTEIAGDPELLERIQAAGGLDLSRVTPEMAQQRREEEQRRHDEEMDVIRSRLAEQEKLSVKDLVWTGEPAGEQYWTIRWLDDKGELLDTTAVKQGDTPAHAALADKEDGEGGLLVFTGWTPTLAAATANVSYTAQFAPGVTVTWRNWDGATLGTKNVAKGSTPVYSGATPTRDGSEDGVSYAFDVWEPEMGPVEEDAAYTAAFKVTGYVIDWYDDSENELGQTTVAVGETPTPPSFRERYEEDGYLYVFDHWEPELAAAEEPASYTAVYTIYCTITWQDDDGNTVDTTTVEYGETPSHDPIEKADTAQYSYKFSGWYPELSEAFESTAYKATYSASTRSYEITWLDDDGNTVGTTTVEYGETPSCEEIAKEETAAYSYEFAGWDPEPVAVTGAASYRATYTANKRSYDITWLDENGGELTKTKVEYGEIPSYDPGIGNGEDTVFNGWNPEPVAVTGEASYTAMVTHRVWVTWYGDTANEVLDAKWVNENSQPVYTGPTPTKADCDGVRYAFTGWGQEGGDYYAWFEESAYLINWYDRNGQLISSDWVSAGSTPTAPSVPQQEEDDKCVYTFNGWTEPIAAASAPTAYYADYTATPKQDSGILIG